MKKMVALLLATVLILSACSQGTSEGDQTSANTQAETTDQQSTQPSGSSTEEKEDVTLEIFQFKVEIVEQLDALIKDFEAEYPYIDVVIDTVGGGQDYGGAFRSRMNSGNEPDIFNIGGPTDRDQWIDFLEPLTDQPWVENSFDGTLDMMTIDGEVYGQPYNLEGYGLIYNVSMFEEAGIDASSIKTLTQLREAFAKLESMKDTLGIDNVLSFSVGDTAWWTAAIHAMNIPFAKQEDPMYFIQGLKDGTQTMAGNDRFMAFTDLLDLYFEYSYSDLMTVSYDDQVGNFALGKTAVLHQGNWTIGMISEIDPEMKIAFLPHPLNDDSSWPNGSIPVGVPNYWCVNKTSPDNEKEAAKLFLDYMASSDRGAKFLVEDCSFIPAFGNITLEPSDQLAASIIEYSAKGYTVPWMWMYAPSGFTDITTKDAIQNYYLGNYDKQAFVEALDAGWQDLSAVTE